jgi:hypothetical protein
MPKTTRYLIILITGFFILLTILKSIYFSNKNGGTDLRIRVVGARLLTTSNSPYFYKWNPKDGEYLLDPNDQVVRLVNGNIVTPAVLYTTYPLYRLSYPSVRVWWTIIQYVLLFITLFLLLGNRQGSLAFIPTVVILTGLVCTDIWLLHIERGQIYIFYTFLFAVIYRLYTSNNKHSQLLSGFIAGLFILFRPFAGIIGLPFLLNGKKKWVLGCIAGFITGCALFVLPQPSLWKGYFAAMNEYASEYTGQSYGNINAKEYPEPAVIEGTNNLGQVQGFNISGLDTVYDYLKKVGITISQNQSYILFGSVVILLCILFFRNKKRDISAHSLFLFAFLLYILAEFFVTVPRGRYNLVQWIFPLSLILQQEKYDRPSFILLITGLLLLHNFPFVVPYQAVLAELLFLGVTIYYLLYRRDIKKIASYC